MPTLPVNIDTTYADSATDASVPLHQSYHDTLHALTNIAAVSVTTFTSAGLTAAATAAGAGGVVSLPTNAVINLATAVTLTDVGLIGDGSATFTVPILGVGIAALTITGTGAYQIPVRGFRMRGPGSRSLGARNANCDGIAVTGQAKPAFSFIDVQNFDSGIVWNNDVGHIYHRDIVVTNNYYGIYCKKNTFDYFIADSRIDGNTFANFATPANQGISGAQIINVHCGFAPFGFYQEATPANQGKPALFLQEMLLRHVRFEQIGNAAIKTDAQQDATNASITSNLIIEHPGFSWNTTTYRLAVPGFAYAVDLSETDRLISILGGPAPFTAGSAGVIRVKKANHQALCLVNASASVNDVTTQAGNANVYPGTNFAVAGANANFAYLSAATVDLPAANSYLQFGTSNVRIGGTNGGNLYADHNIPIQGRNSGSGYAAAWSIQPNGAGAFLAVGGTAVATASRPTVASLGGASSAGLMVYDTTLRKPIWSDGSVWRDSAGTAV